MSLGLSVLRNQKVGQRNLSALRYMVLNSDRIMNLTVRDFFSLVVACKFKKRRNEERHLGLEIQGNVEVRKSRLILKKLPIKLGKKGLFFLLPN